MINREPPASFEDALNEVVEAAQSVARSMGWSEARQLQDAEWLQAARSDALALHDQSSLARVGAVREAVERFKQASKRLNEMPQSEYNTLRKHGIAHEDVPAMRKLHEAEQSIYDALVGNCDATKSASMTMSGRSERMPRDEFEALIYEHASAFADQHAFVRLNGLAWGTPDTQRILKRLQVVEDEARHALMEAAGYDPEEE